MHQVVSSLLDDSAESPDGAKDDTEEALLFT